MFFIDEVHEELAKAQDLLMDIVDNTVPFINALESDDTCSGMDLEVLYDDICKFLGRDNEYGVTRPFKE